MRVRLAMPPKILQKNRQFTLKLPRRAAFGKEEFFVSSCNSRAVDWIDRWPKWPLHGLVICGPPGSGKTHLSAVWQARSNAAGFKGNEILQGLEVLLNNESLKSCFVDDADCADQEILFHIFNCVVSRGGQLVVTAVEPPARWVQGLPDLVSRLKTLPVTQIERPNDEMLQVVLMKMFSDRQLTVSLDVLTYIIVRMDRSFDSARYVVETLDVASLSYQRAITIPFVREVFKEWT